MKSKNTKFILVFVIILVLLCFSTLLLMFQNKSKNFDTQNVKYTRSYTLPELMDNSPKLQSMDINIKLPQENIEVLNTDSLKYFKIEIIEGATLEINMLTFEKDVLLKNAGGVITETRFLFTEEEIKTDDKVESLFTIGKINNVEILRPTNTKASFDGSSHHVNYYSKYPDGKLSKQMHFITFENSKYDFVEAHIKLEGVKPDNFMLNDVFKISDEIILSINKK